MPDPDTPPAPGVDDPARLSGRPNPAAGRPAGRLNPAAGRPARSTPPTGSPAGTRPATAGNSGSNGPAGERSAPNGAARPAAPAGSAAVTSAAASSGSTGGSGSAAGTRAMTGSGTTARSGAKPVPARPQQRPAQPKGQPTRPQAKPQQAKGKPGKPVNDAWRQKQAKRRRRQQRRTSPGQLVLLAGGAVVVVVAIFIGLRALGVGNPSAATGRTLAAPNVVHDVTNIPESTLAAVGVPATPNGPVSTSTPVPIKGGPPLTSGGKPEIFYGGAEYCPYCAAERWVMAAALSKFGTFQHLGATESSTSDVYPGTRTLSFYGSSYASPYLTFTPVEMTTNQPYQGYYKTLQTPTAAQTALMNTYDKPPYVGQTGGIPFIDIANKYIMTVQYSPQVLAGLSQSQIAADLKHPSSPVAQAIDGSTNVFMATVCKALGNAPASVCASPTVQSAERHVA